MDEYFDKNEQPEPVHNADTNDLPIELLEHLNNLTTATDQSTLTPQGLDQDHPLDTTSINAPVINDPKLKPSPIIGKDGIERVIYNTNLFLPEIQNGRIQVIEQPEKTIVSVKLKPEQMEKLRNILGEGKKDIINYSHTDDELQFPVREILVEDTKVIIFDGVDKSGRPVDTVNGVLYLEYPPGKEISEKELIELLNIKTEDSSKEKLQQQYANTLYQLQNKTNPPEGLSFTLEPVFPGYETTTIPDRAEELIREHGLFYFSHTFIGVPPEVVAQNLVKIIESGGLLSANERVKRQLFTGARIGFNPTSDFRSGGADYVFTSIVTKDLYPTNQSRGPIELVMDPSLANRLDWFSYPNDSYGSNPLKYNHLTETPEEALRRTSEKGPRGEQIFPYGIGLDKIQFVSCSNNVQRTALLMQLLSHGIKEINGKAIQDWIVTQETCGEVFDKIGYKDDKLTPKIPESPPRILNVSSFKETTEPSSPRLGEVYEQIETHERYFVKVYDDPSQASCAYVSNKIYQLAGVRVLDGQLIETETSKAFSTRYNPDMREASRQEYSNIKEWLVPMSFLLDWEAPFERPVIDEQTNETYLTNHTGTLLFNGENKRKNGNHLKGDSIFELDFLKTESDPDSGKLLFNISDNEINFQVKLFLIQVTEADILRIVDEAKFTNDSDRNQVLNLLLSRRRFLENSFSQAN